MGVSQNSQCLRFTAVLNYVQLIATTCYADIYILNKNKHITAAEACESLSISRQTLWRWRKAGVVPKGGLLRRKTVVFTEQEFAEIQAYALQIVPLDEQPAQLGLSFTSGRGYKNEN